MSPYSQISCKNLLVVYCDVGKKKLTIRSSSVFSHYSLHDKYFFNKTIFSFFFQKKVSEIVKFWMKNTKLSSLCGNIHKSEWDYEVSVKKNRNHLEYLSWKIWFWWCSKFCIFFVVFVCIRWFFDSLEISNFFSINSFPLWYNNSHRYFP